MFSLSKSSMERRKGVDERLIEISDLAIQITKVDFGHPGDAGVRTAKRQKELFDKGLSKADGYERKSYHQSGKALDFYAYVNGQATWDEKQLAQVACALLQAANMLGYKLEWGGLFSFKDMPHVQLGD